MRTYPTQERLKQLLDYDPETGLFSRLSGWRGKKVGTIDAKGYVRICVDYSIFRAHRLAWIYMTGEIPDDQIDHVNGDRSDNRWANLRSATQSQNQFNRSVRSENCTGMKGVTLQPNGTYRAQIFIEGKLKCLGRHKTADEAKAAYNAAAMIIHGEYFKP